MHWWRIASNPHVVRAGGIWAVFKQLRLAYRLLRDERVPMLTKMVLPATRVYLASPLDVLPDLIPIVGQVDDIGLVILGLIAFVKLCPQGLVAEHEAELDGNEPTTKTGARSRPDEPVDVRYEWVDERPRR